MSKMILIDEATVNLALEALEAVRYHGWGESQKGYDARLAAIAALREALAEQPAQQEPVAHCEAGPDYCPVCYKESKPTYGSEEIRKLREVIANQAKIIANFEPLTDEEISKIAINTPPMVHEFARAIEAKLKEKNT